MWFCNITISHSSTPYGILGEMFKLLSVSCETHTYPTNHTQAGVTSARPCICYHQKISESQKLKSLPKLAENHWLVMCRRCFLHHSQQVRPALPSVLFTHFNLLQGTYVLLNTHRCPLNKSWPSSGWNLTFTSPQPPGFREQRGSVQWLPDPEHCTGRSTSVYLHKTLPSAKTVQSFHQCPAQHTPTDHKRPRSRASSSLRRLAPQCSSDAFVTACSTQPRRALFMHLLFSYLAINHPWSLSFLHLCILRVYGNHEKISTNVC